MNAHTVPWGPNLFASWKLFHSRRYCPLDPSSAPVLLQWNHSVAVNRKIAPGSLFYLVYRRVDPPFFPSHIHRHTQTFSFSSSHSLLHILWYFFQELPLFRFLRGKIDPRACLQRLFTPNNSSRYFLQISRSIFHYDHWESSRLVSKWSVNSHR